MENFQDFETLYAHLDDHAAEYNYPHQIGDQFQKLRDKMQKENKADDAEQAQWEVDFWNFVLAEGEVRPSSLGTNEKGEESNYPDFNRFTSKTYEHLVKRLESAKNPLIKARYAQILWKSPKKHKRYAEIAIDNYLSLIPLYEQQDREAPKGHYGLNVVHAVENAYFLSKQAKYEAEKLKSEVRRLICDFSFESSSLFALRAQLLTLMFEQKFPKDHFIGLNDICWKTAELLGSSRNAHGAIDMLELGEKVELRLEIHSRNWQMDIANSYEQLMIDAEQAENPASVTFCQWALEHYKRAKDENKVKELEKKYGELRNSIKLSGFKTEIDLSDHIRKCQAVAEKVVDKNPDEIIKILMLDKNLLPKYTDLEAVVEENSKRFVGQHLFQTELLDQSGNVAQHFSDEDEKKYYGILQQYALEIRFSKFHLIHEIMLAGLRARKISAGTFLEFFRDHSWFGKDLTRPLPNSQQETYSWLNVLAPAIQEFFIEMDYALASAQNHPNLVLCIDSLTLKIEGLLRDMCRFKGIATFYMIKDSKGRSISREKDIHALLYEDVVRELFNEDDLLLFKFLLVEKAGYNLRHRVAHALLRFDDYGVEYFYLLLLALLKLGKYDFATESQT